jgi:hypothetical protein
MAGPKKGKIDSAAEHCCAEAHRQPRVLIWRGGCDHGLSGRPSTTHVYTTKPVNIEL